MIRQNNIVIEGDVASAPRSQKLGSQGTFSVMSFMLSWKDEPRTSKTGTTFTPQVMIAVQLKGKMAEAHANLMPGESVHVEGKLTRNKGIDKKTGAETWYYQVDASVFEIIKETKHVEAEEELPW